MADQPEVELQVAGNVEVDDKGARAFPRELTGKVGGQAGLAHTALAVGE